MELKVELESGRSRGFAYVTFETHDAMSSACELLNGTELPEGGGTRCKVMPAEDKTYGGSGGNSNKRRGSNTPVTSSGGTDRSALTKLGPIAHTSDSAETDTRGGNPDQGLTPSPDSEFEVKKKVSSKKKASERKEDPQRDPKDDGTLRRQREEGDDDDVLSGQLPGPRKYSRLNSPSAERENGGESDDGTDVDTEDVETEDGPEAASRPQRVKSTTTNRRTKAEEEATDAAMALGKVTLGVVAEEDPLEETEENKTEENKEKHEADEADDDEAPEDTEGPKDKKLAGVNTDSKPSECDDESPVETTAITTADYKYEYAVLQAGAAASLVRAASRVDFPRATRGLGDVGRRRVGYCAVRRRGRRVCRARGAARDGDTGHRAADVETRVGTTRGE